MAITNAIEDLFASIYELFATVFSTIYNILQTFVNAIISFFSGIVNMFGDILSGAVDIVGGVGKFLLGKSSTLLIVARARLTLTGNIVIIGLLAAGAYIYVQYTAQGRQVASGKKTA